MRLLRTFKNPDDPYDSEFIDEEEVEVDEAILQDLLDNDVQVTSDSDDDAYNRDADYQFDPDSSDSSNMDEMAVMSEDPATDDNECTSSNKRAIKTKATSATSETKMDEGGGSSKKTADVAYSADDATKSTIYDLNEDDEVDETVRSIIAAIKKPRASPPEIKLDDFVTDISFHPERDYIAVATIMGDVCLYKYSNQENTLLRTIEVHAKACRDVEFSQDGSNLLTCSKDKSIMVTDMETEKLKKFYESAHDEAINKLHVIDENLFATGDDEGTVKLWDLRIKNEIFALKEVEDYIAQLLTNDEGKLLLATSGDGFLTTLSIGARKLYYQSELYEEEFTCMALYRSDSKLVVGSSKGNLYTYNWGQFTYHNYKFSGVKSSMNVMMPITDRIGCVAGEDGIIRAVHVAPFCNLGIVGQHAMPIESLDISNNGELIASSSHDNDVRFWNVKYFEDFADIKYNVKHNTYKERRHNLPSSKYSNPADFFSDLAKGTEHE